MIRTGSACGPRDGLLADRDYINTLMPTLMRPMGCNPRYSVEQLRGEAFLDGSKAKNELGRGPQISLEEGTKQDMQWCKQRSTMK